MTSWTLSNPSNRTQKSDPRGTLSGEEKQQKRETSVQKTWETGIGQTEEEKQWPLNLPPLTQIQSIYLINGSSGKLIIRTKYSNLFYHKKLKKISWVFIWLKMNLENMHGIQN